MALATVKATFPMPGFPIARDIVAALAEVMRPEGGGVGAVAAPAKAWGFERGALTSSEAPMAPRSATSLTGSP